MKDSRILRTFKISTIEGIFAQIYGALATGNGVFLVKLLGMLSANPLHYSLLTAIGQISQVFQVFGVAVDHYFKNRKKNCLWLTFIGRFLSFFLGLAFLFRSSNQGIYFVLAIFLFSSAFLSIGANIWIAWIADLIPLKFRGRFMSRRAQILLICSLVVSYAISI
ncbi:MAG: MFS transporter, partial [Candidatus Cloacimonadaceae bacterium]|nr:MFS transporter [Candidatus Cloacimonadaceae bacterium]